MVQSKETYGGMFRNRFLPERGRIIFEYPPNKNDENVIVFFPFYENPKIDESQSANYNTYDLIGRAGNLYAYTGAQSRKLKIQSYLTLPHLAMHEMGIDRFLRIYKNSGDEAEKSLFSQPLKKPPQKQGDVNSSLAGVLQNTWNLLNSGDIEEAINNDLPDSVGTIGQSAAINSLPVPEKLKVIDTLLFFVALLRTSVVNNAANPLQGPPLLRLDYGTMYQQVPCICKSYNISFEESTTYDLTTLTPFRVNFSLNLEEIRLGDFGKYEPAKVIQRDNLTGWESVINSPHTTDPISLGGL